MNVGETTATFEKDFLRREGGKFLVVCVKLESRRRTARVSAQQATTLTS